MTMALQAPIAERVSALLVDPAARVWQEIVTRAPTLGSAIGLVFALWIVAKIARAATTRLLSVTRLDAAVKQTFLGRILAGLSEGLTASKALGTLVYAVILLLALSAAADILGLTAVQNALAGVLAYLPRLGSGLAMLAVGGYVAGVAARAIGTVLKELKSPYAGMAESVTETVILLLTITVTANALGADLSFVTQNLMLIVGVLVVTGAFLFGWSMRRPAEEIIANYYLRRLVNVGDKVKLNDVEGTVERFAALGLLLRDDSGQEHFIPARFILNGLERAKPSSFTRSK